MPLDCTGRMPVIEPTLAEIADNAPLGLVREPSFRLVADLIRMTISGIADDRMGQQASQAA